MPRRIASASDGAKRHAETSRERIKLLGESEILVRETVRVVGRQGERNFVPPNINVRMMPRLFGQLRDGINELDRQRKVLELKSARDGRAFLFPTWHGRQRSLDLGSVEFWHR